MERTDVRKVWTVPAHSGMGPVTVEVELPKVKVTDSEGRYILIAPSQSETLGDKISDIHYWMNAEDDWVEPDPA
ncbi:hypothetical protein F0L68_36885 [Solihabitans fulvus]|uniref:Uncharacterized protein n=1 Tax=Solihabitans fulvus TaxID=1892852 RepID=A0A5B2WP14_9PSEU|nr:hypothetical protein [Solihabitans fulvus]KAA2252129.1 hypothetical protein F0L68_36885 [Solihabitans fulvus]